MTHSKKPLKILHTSDWHLGRTLYGRKRYDEFQSFLDWLAQTLKEESVDVLLVAGDIFDTGTPSNKAQELYYDFLCRAAASSCRHVVVIAGNHDSPTFLSAPRGLLKALHVHVVGSVSQTPSDEVLVLKDGDGIPELVVCAVPYLRDRDVRTAEAGEGIEDKERKLAEGIAGHYSDVFSVAFKERDGVVEPRPVVAMGHLFAAGGKTVDGDGVRDLYVGSLSGVEADIFSETLDYVALGHLHVPQKVAGSDVIRYSGSPIPMGFGEAKQSKSVCLVELKSGNADVRLLNVPVFQKLEQVKGGWETLSARILELTTAGSDAWLEIVYDGEEVIPDLREKLDQAVGDSAIEILRVKNNRVIERALEQSHDEETLDDLTLEDVFERCLNKKEVPDDQRPGLWVAYGEVLTSLQDDDVKAE